MEYDIIGEIPTFRLISDFVEYLKEEGFDDADIGFEGGEVGGYSVYACNPKLNEIINCFTKWKKIRSD